MFSSLLNAQDIPMYVGSYTDEGSEGIYSYDFNIETGKLTNKKLAIEAINPSFITYSSNKKFMYAVSESDQGSKVLAYSVNKNGLLNLINEVSSNGKGPCHVQLNEDSNKAVVSNYGGGSFSIYSVEKNGALKNAFQVVDNNTAEIKAHAHSAKFYKNELFIADLGRDFLSHYVEKEDKYILKENYIMAPKAGPRHFEITKNGEFVYVINELNATVTVLKRGTEKFTEIQSITTLSNDFAEFNACADIHLSKDEQFLYGSNRGENTIVVYKRNSENGMLERIQSISVEGNWPRNFTISPNGKFLLVANQRSNNISVYKVNTELGKLTFLHSVEASKPVCLLF